MHQKELAEKKDEEQQDYWFNCLWPMTKVKPTWQETWLAKEENSRSDSGSEEEVEVTSESFNGNPGSCNSNLGGEEDRREEQPNRMDINMVFMIQVEFHAPAEYITELTLGAGHAMFEKPGNPGAHIKPLFIWGHLDGMSIIHMLVDGGASVNILPLSLLKKLGHVERDLKCTNLSLSGFAGDPTEAKGIIYKELMVRSKIVGNECVPSSLQ
jgi:hypothetical protein